MVRSRNEQWRQDSFHERLAELVGLSAGDAALDLGCGQGATVPHLLARVGHDGTVVALDRDERALRALEHRHAAEISARTLDIVQADIAAGLPFPDDTFTGIVCQNVVECVRDRQALLKEARRVLRPGGRLLVGHHDFDAVILASGERGLTRRLVHGFAEHVQDWQDASDGQMGRELPGLVGACGFRDATTETVLFVDLQPADGTYALAYIGWVRDTAPLFGIAETEIKTWLDDLAERAANATFYFAIPWVYVVARK